MIYVVGILVQCQRGRSLRDNRAIARKLLLLKLDEYVNKGESKLAQRVKKLRKNKARKYARARRAAQADKELREEAELLERQLAGSEMNMEENDQVLRHEEVEKGFSHPILIERETPPVHKH